MVDYWDDIVVAQVTEIVSEFEDIFPRTFTDLKGIKEEADAMKIQLKEGIKPIKEKPYRLN